MKKLILEVVNPTRSDYWKKLEHALTLITMFALSRLIQKIQLILVHSEKNHEFHDSKLYSLEKYKDANRFLGYQESEKIDSINSYFLFKIKISHLIE